MHPVAKWKHADPKNIQQQTTNAMTKERAPSVHHCSGSKDFGLAWSMGNNFWSRIITAVEMVALAEL